MIQQSIKIKLILLISFCICFSTASLAQDVQRILDQAEQAIKKQDELHIKSTLYLHYESEEMYDTISNQLYLTFPNKKDYRYILYQGESKNSRFIYNGSENFFLDLADSTIQVAKHPKEEDIYSNTTFNISYVTWRLGLSNFKSNKDIGKKISQETLNGKKVYKVELNIGQNFLSKTGVLNPMKIKAENLLIVYLDQKTLLPLELISQRVGSKDFVKTKIEYLSLKGKRPNETSWFTSTYSDFKPYKKISLAQLALNQEAPSWNMSLAKQNGSRSLQEYKGKYLILEFYIKNCGYCIEGVKKLNILQEKLAGKNVAILGVNSQDSEADLHSFIRTQKPAYDIVWDKDGSVSKAYGVDGVPHVFILDQQGKVIYNGGLDQDKIWSVLDGKI